MTIGDLARNLDLVWCGGSCGLSATRHRKGVVLLGVVHYDDRRLTVQTARTLCLLAARNDREQDAGYLNVDLFDFWYAYHDSVVAYRMARSVGIRLPARVFDAKRAECRRLAAMRGVKLSKYRNAFQWAMRP